MAGILDNKKRVMDVLVTHEGRKQASAGTYAVRFATFTDYQTFYHASGSLGVADDATKRIFFEATNRYQDMIVPELEPGGNSVSQPFRAGDFIVHGKSIASGTFRSGSVQGTTENISGPELDRIKTNFLESIAQNFKDLRTISTRDTFAINNGFIISPTTGTFLIGEDTVYNEAPPGGMLPLESSPSMFQDRKLSHLPNFRYLPPVNVSYDSSPGAPLGTYPRLNEVGFLRFEDLMRNLKDKEHREFYFEQTSRDNNILSQFFEFDRRFLDGLQKLSIIDFGNYPGENSQDTEKQVFFVGKIKRDSNGTDTFLNIFTVVVD